MFGVLVHDMNIDKAARAAVVPLSAYAAASASGMALDQFLSKSDHTHVERASVATHYNSTLPKVHPPRDDDRRYQQQKRQNGLGTDDRTSIWPSV